MYVDMLIPPKANDVVKSGIVADTTCKEDGDFFHFIVGRLLSRCVQLLRTNEEIYLRR